MTLRALQIHDPKKLLTDQDAGMRHASAKAKELDPSAYACRMQHYPPGQRCQIRIEVERWGEDGNIHVSTALVGSGRTWAEALEMAWNWKQETLKRVIT